MKRTASLLLLTLLLIAALLPVPHLARAIAREPGEVPDTLEFNTVAPDTEPEEEPEAETEAWMRTPIGDRLLTEHEQFRAYGARASNLSIYGDYNRVDRMRWGLGYQFQQRDPMAPRLGGRIEYAFGRDRALYGIQIEQPLIPPGRIAIGGSIVRRTDHSELQQVSDLENSMAILFARQDYRDYWEREGIGAYLAWRVPDFSTVSLHVRRDQYRSLVDRGATSWFQKDRTLRLNPPIDDGETHTFALRFEKAVRKTQHTRAGFYHWVESEWAGRSLGGDFTYTRLLGDLRSVVRLTPASTLWLRAVAGYTAAGELPAQKRFPLGGVDGLRAHTFAQFNGNQLALLQAEYVIGLWQLRTGAFEGGLHAIVFADAGQAWNDARWSIGRREIQVDGGVGLAAAEDKLRIYLARDLRRASAPFVTSVRLQRPF